MTTARERMKALSGLSGSHSARAHFLAITQGTGTGQTIFASMFSVQIEEPRLFAVQRPKRDDSNDYCPTPRRLSADNEKAVAVFTRDESLSVRTAVDELCVRQTVATSLVVRDLGQERLTVRQSDVMEIN